MSKAIKKHNDWLMKRGLHPTQLKKVRAGSVNALPCYKTENKYPLSNDFAPVPGKTDVMTNRFKERPEVRREIERKALMTAPAYSKGPYQYVTGADVTTLGKKV